MAGKYTRKEIDVSDPRERFETVINAVNQATPGDEFRVAFSALDATFCVHLMVLRQHRVFVVVRLSDGTYILGETYDITSATRSGLAAAYGDAVETVLSMPDIDL